MVVVVHRKIERLAVLVPRGSSYLSPTAIMQVLSAMLCTPLLLFAVYSVNGRLLEGIERRRMRVMAYLDDAYHSPDAGLAWREIASQNVI